MKLITVLCHVFYCLAQSDYLKMYTMYCSNQPYAILKLQAVRQSKPFARFMYQCAALPECRNLNLANFLYDLIIEFYGYNRLIYFFYRLKPVQRICKYPLLLREVIKSTESDHPDSENLVKALLKIETVVAMVNEGARQADSVHKMIELQNKFTQVGMISISLISYELTNMCLCRKPIS